MSQAPTTTKIYNSERIVRVFRKICQAKLKVLARTRSKTMVAVRGEAFDVRPFRDLDGHVELGLVLKNISMEGTTHLFEEKAATLEFIFLASKVQCYCKILHIRSSEVTLGLPQCLVSIEKRAGNRFLTTPEISAFLQPSCWNPEQQDYYTPPLFSQHSHLNNWLPLKDISIDGACIKSLFPSASMTLEAGTSDSKAILHLPMEPPLHLGFEVKWTKILRESEKGQGKKKMMTFLIGCRIFDIGTETKKSLARYIQNLIQANAI